MRFPHQERHQIFLEPEGLDVDEIYVNGFSMSLPAAVQEELVHALPGLEDAVVMRPGYAVEYDFIQPTELRATSRSDPAAGLFLAGQINGTSGYEEAAAQGLMAGINAHAPPRGSRQSSWAARQLHRHPGRRPDDEGLPRAVSDVHVARRASPAAPHRQRRLAADAYGPSIGLVDDGRWDRFRRRAERYERNRVSVLGASVIVPNGDRIPAARALKQPEVRLERLVETGELALDIDPASRDIDLASVETSFKYEGYLKRQEESVERQRRQEGRRDPLGLRIRRHSRAFT